MNLSGSSWMGYISCLKNHPPHMQLAPQMYACTAVILQASRHVPAYATAVNDTSIQLLVP